MISAAQQARAGRGGHRDGRALPGPTAAATLLSSLALAVVACDFQPTGLTVSEPGLDAPDARDGVVVDAAPIDAPPLACPTGYVALGTGTYRQVTAAATWLAARADCADDDDQGTTGRTHLVVVDGPVEHAGVRAVFPGPKLWLGLSDRVTTAVWRWVTLEPTGNYPPASGPPWKGGQPNDGGGGTEDCVVMEADGDWDDRPCDNDTEAYVCECDAYPEVEAQSQP